MVYVKNNIYSVSSLLMLLSGMTVCGAARAENTAPAAVNTQAFSISVSPSRLIYPLNSNGVVLTIKNPQDYPILAKTTLVAEDKKSAVPFIVTPPLFKLDGGQQSKVRVVKTGGDYPADKESMAWVCVRGVPPEAAGEALKGQSKQTTSVSVQLSISTCVKLILRPAALNAGPQDVGQQIAWHREGGRLVARNLTPYYLSLTDVKNGGQQVKDLDYLPPLGTRSFSTPEKSSGDITWHVITDYGGNSREFKTTLK